METDKEYIDVDSALRRVGGNRDLYKKLLGQFIESNSVDELEKNLNSNEINSATINAHSIKGVGANLSLLKLTTCAAELEKILKNGEDYKDKLAELKEIYDVTAKQIAIVSAQ